MPKNLLAVFFILYIFPYAMASEVFGFGRRAAAEPNPPPAPPPQPPPQPPKYQPLKIDGMLYCPAEGDDREKLEELLTYSNIRKTLFPKNFNQNEEKFCKYGVEALLDYRKNKDGLAEMWGENDQHLMYFFAFQYWREESSISEVCEKVKNEFMAPLIKIGFLPIYTIGYDSSINKVAWTRHSFRSSSDDVDTSGLQNVPYQPTNYEAGWNTKPFRSEFENEYFTKIDRAFDTFNENNENSKMIKQQLVPEEDMPPMRKKATNHLINIAPLWNELGSLMEAINAGIRKANYHIQLKFPTCGTSTSTTIGRSPKHQLVVHTKLFYASREEPLHIPYLWLKFVHYQPKNAGVLIYVHNIPGQEPQQENRLCDIDNIVVCNFTEWADENDTSIENLNYAYCCKPSAPVIQKYFPIRKIRTDVENVLDIGKIVNGDTSELEASNDSWEIKYTKRSKQDDYN